MELRDVFLLDTLRTPFGILNGVFKHSRAEYLATAVIRGLLDRNGVAGRVDHVVIANAVGGGGNISRLSWLTADGSLDVPCTTIDFQCGGGIQSILFGQMLIQTGRADLVLVGGTESVSTEPLRMLKPHDPDHSRWAEGVQVRGRFSSDEIGDPDMAYAAEQCAMNQGFTREELDAIAIRSHMKANMPGSIEALKPYIQAIGPVDRDEGLGRMRIEALIRRMPPLLDGGLLTAGNTCLMNDGAAMALLCSDGFLAGTGKNPLGKILGINSGARHPKEASLGHLVAMDKVLGSVGLTLDDLDQIEINEAFASKCLSLSKHFGMDPMSFEKKVNPLGGALVYGHPYSASGTNLLIQLVAGLQAGQLGIAAMGVAGGQGNALIFERG